MEAEIGVLVGETLDRVIGDVGGEEVTFRSEAGKTWRLFHEQDCCESVTVEEIHGDLNDLVGSPILTAEELSSDPEIDEAKPPGDYSESWTWTFYRLRTIKGVVTIRYLGESNGYYSESVSFEEVE